MRSIRRLSEDVSNKVAAGEVVERPFNIVKELAENSIDAGASRILIEVEDGGMGLIRVTDDGYGIHPDEIAYAVERFATSKVSTIDEVYSVSTFGFRGEALAAISSVSSFSIKSYRKDAGARELRLEYGGEAEILPSEEVAGTVVSAGGLFKNVPARLKFFKSRQASERDISKFVKHFSLLHPEIEFDLYINGKNTYRAEKGALERARQVFREAEIVENYAEYADMSVHIVCGLPVVQKYRKDNIIIGINGRLVKDASLTQAVVQAFYRLMPENRFPVCCVNLNIQPEQIDANIHPAKTNVKLLRQRDVFGFVYDAVRSAVTSGDAKQPREEVSANRVSEERLEYSYDITKDMTSERSFKSPQKAPGRMDKAPDRDNNSAHGEIFEHARTEERDADIKILGQLFDSVILCEKDGKAVYIDQHVAHERILYEKFAKEAELEISSIVLFEPVVIEVDDEELEAVQAGGETLLKFGYEAESFGGNSVKISKVPADRVNRNIEKDVREILSDMAEMKKERRSDYAVLTMSCKQAVKAGEKLDMYEMEKIVYDLFETDNPYTCPHGRPIIYEVSRNDILRKFGR